MGTPRRKSRQSHDVMPEISRIGFVLAERRLALGLTQQTLADLAGTSRSTVQALEYGTGSIKLALLVEIADVLGLRIDALPGAP
jgi:transcriptional regulator with XRE-family HTH domain